MEMSAELPKAPLFPVPYASREGPLLCRDLIAELYLHAHPRAVSEYGASRCEEQSVGSGTKSDFSVFLQSFSEFVVLSLSTLSLCPHAWLFSDPERTVRNRAGSDVYSTSDATMTPP